MKFLEKQWFKDFYLPVKLIKQKISKMTFQEIDDYYNKNLSPNGFNANSCNSDNCEGCSGCPKYTYEYSGNWWNGNKRDYKLCNVKFTKKEFNKIIKKFRKNIKKYEG